MAIGINDLDDEDVIEVILDQNQQVQTPPPPTNDLEDEFMSDFLKSKGIEDMSKIKFEDENEQIIERDWKDLSKEEKFNILNTQFTQEEEVQDNLNELTDEEINFINQLRELNLTPEQFIRQFSGEPQGPQYKIDDLDDDEVYILDLESRIGGELTEEQISLALTSAKQNEDFYKKLVEGIRKEYKEREDLANQQELAMLEEQQRQAFEEYQAKVIDAIDNFDSIGGLDLNFEDKDKDELAKFMLLQDEETGSNYLYQALQDPKILTRVAWFILRGEEAFDNITDYFSNLIKQVSDAQYKKGLEDGKKGVVTKPTIVIDKNNIKNNNNSYRSYNSINDLDDDD